MTIMTCIAAPAHLQPPQHRRLQLLQLPLQLGNLQAAGPICAHDAEHPIDHVGETACLIRAVPRGSWNWENSATGSEVSRKDYMPSGIRARSGS